MRQLCVACRIRRDAAKREGLIGFVVCDECREATPPQAHEFECLEDAVQALEEARHDLDMAQSVVDDLTQERDELKARVAALEARIQVAVPVIREIVSMAKPSARLDLLADAVSAMVEPEPETVH